VANLELDLFFNFGGHWFALTVRKSLSYSKLGGQSAEAKDVDSFRLHRVAFVPQSRDYREPKGYGATGKSLQR
jgi:hypothetical protein